MIRFVDADVLPLARKTPMPDRIAAPEGTPLVPPAPRKDRPRKAAVAS